MKYIKYFNFLIERTDIVKSDIIDKLFNDIVSYIKNEKDFNSQTSLNIPRSFLHKDELVIVYDKDYKWFSSKNGFGFGKSEIRDGNKINTIYIEIDETNKKIDTDFVLSSLINNEFEIKHELVHLYDDINYKHSRKGYSSTELLKRSEDKKYYNTNREINAYYMMSINNIIKELNNGNTGILKTFNIFKEFFIKDPSIKFFYKNLTIKNKKKIISRLYNFFNDIKEKWNKKVGVDGVEPPES